MCEKWSQRGQIRDTTKSLSFVLHWLGIIGLQWVDREVDSLIHAIILIQTDLWYYTAKLSPLQHLSPQRIITRFYKAVTARVPIFIVPAGGPLLPLSPCIIALHMALLPYGWTRGLKRFIRILFLFTSWAAYGVIWCLCSRTDPAVETL